MSDYMGQFNDISTIQSRLQFFYTESAIFILPAIRKLVLGISQDRNVQQCYGYLRSLTTLDQQHPPRKCSTHS